MGEPRGTSVGFLGATRLCYLLLFDIKRFSEEETADNAIWAHSPNSDPAPRAYTVRHAFYSSLILVLISGLTGYGLGKGLGALSICASGNYVSLMQIVGASLLLWGTLFIRGWDIQSNKGITFTERVNQWIYRALYFLGTAIIVCSLVWPQCIK